MHNRQDFDCEYFDPQAEVCTSLAVMGVFLRTINFLLQFYLNIIVIGFFLRQMFGFGYTFNFKSYLWRGVSSKLLR